MSDTNGTTKVLSLEAARTAGLRKGNDFITVQQAYDMVIQECAKVHEHYLNQLPHFTARMIQDALMTYGLIVPQPGTDIAPQIETATREGDRPEEQAIAPSASAEDPSACLPAEPLFGVSPAPESTPPDAVAPASQAHPLPDNCESILADMPEDKRAQARADFEAYYSAMASFAPTEPAV